MASLIMVRVNIPTMRQKYYFGSYAWRPYLLASVDDDIIIDEVFIKRLIYRSFYNESLDGVTYKKYFDIDFESSDSYYKEFQFAFASYDVYSKRLVFDMFYPIQF